MIEADDYIENETENARPVFSTVLDAYPLALKLEMQEEIDFQNRLEKEKQVIFKIRQIAQARLEYNQEWLDSIQNETLGLDDYMKIFINPDVLAKQSKAKREELRFELDSIDWTFEFSDNKCFLKRAIDCIDQNVPYLLEVLYMEMYGFYTRGTCLGKKRTTKNIETHYISIILKMLDPFLTNEFKCFFLKIKNSPIIQIDMEYLTPGKQILNNAIFLNVNVDMMKQLFLLYPVTIDRVGKIPESSKNETTKLLNEGMDFLKKIKNQETESNLKPLIELKEERNYANFQYFDFFTTSFFKIIRSDFGPIYNIIRRIEVIVSYIDEVILNEKIKIKRVAVSVPKELHAEMVEQIPDLDDVFLDKAEMDLVAQNNNIQAFLELKKQQLFLWQERVAQRKEQQAQIQQDRFTLKKVAEHGLENTMDVQRAQQLDRLFKKIDKDDQSLYDSLFKSDLSCKPHNVRFQDIEKLIKNFGGSLKNDLVSSHFSVHLPDTYSLWIEDNVSATLSYMDVPQVVGGSYKPHGHSGEEWTRSAHDLLKKAFIKAGITPERLARAEQMTVELFCEMPRGLLAQNAVIKNPGAQKVRLGLNLS